MEEIQEKITEFCKKHNLSGDIRTYTLDLVSEIGEFSKEVLKSGNYGKKEIEVNDKMKEELGDAFFSLIVLANSLDLNLDKTLDLILNKYEKRSETGSIGSED